MKKILMSSIVILIFSVSIVLFQISCQKTLNAQSPKVATTGIILYAEGFAGYGYGNYQATSYWTMNTDGSNATKIPLTFNSNLNYSMLPHLSSDGKSIYFTATDSNGGYNSYLMICGIDGTNLKTLLTNPGPVSGAGTDIEIGGIY